MRRSARASAKPRASKRASAPQPTARGQRTSVTSSRAAAARRARARWPPGARGARRASPASGARATPRTARDRAGRRAPARAAPRRAPASRTATTPSTHVAVPGERLRRAGMTDSPRPRSSGRWRSGVASVLSTATSAPAGVRGGGHGRDVEHVEARVGGRLDHTSVAPVQRRADTAASRSAPAAPRRRAARAAARRARGARVAVGRRHQHVAGAQARAAAPRDSAAIPEANATASAALELAERRLVAAPTSGSRRARSRTATRRAARRRWNGAANAGPGRNGLPSAAAGSPACTTRVPSRLMLTGPLAAREAAARCAASQNGFVSTAPAAAQHDRPVGQRERVALGVDHRHRPGDLVGPVVADLDDDRLRRALCAPRRPTAGGRRRRAPTCAAGGCPIRSA